MKRIRASFFPPVALDAKSSVPLYRQLYDSFRDGILNGQLRPGQRVPSTRALAAELGISRIPVLGAFDQLLAEGYLQTFTGSGTVVARSIPEETMRFRKSGPPEAVRPHGPRRISRSGKKLLASPPQPWFTHHGAFRVSLPALDDFPVGIWSKLLARHSRHPLKRDMAYADPMGYFPLRKAIAEYLATVRAVRCNPRQVMITTGSQQALQLSTRVLLDPGDLVWMEEPGYPGAHQALITFGAQLVPIAVDDEGLKVEEGIRRCAKARAVYITPSHQYPLGMTLSAARRMRLLDWATRNGSWILEDDYDSEYRYGSRPVASLQGLDTDARVVYIGTFSKVLFPALRIGYAIIPEDLVPAFSAARDASDIFSSTLYQMVLTDFIREGHFARHIRRMRMLYMERRLALVKAAEEHLGPDFPIMSAEAGMHLVVLFPDGINDVEIGTRAARDGLAAMPLSVCYAHRPTKRGLILAYAVTSPREIQEGMKKLAAIIRAVRG
jgi:GntR family transcriptional regulator/MocR family aminotransferase